MQKFLFLLISALLINVAFIKAQSLIVPENSRYIIKDSAKVLVLDSLVLKKKSSLIIQGKKNFTIEAKTIILEDKTAISAHDSLNNGTNLIIKGGFVKLSRSVIDVSGLTYIMGNKNAPNGNGGELTLLYHPNALTPQANQNKSPNYIEVLTRGASTHINPFTDINNLWYRINLGSGYGRLAAGVPQGKVYDASEGTTGKVIIKSILEN